MSNNKTKVYLAGKVSGLDYLQVSHKFGSSEVELIREGYEVVNPLNIVDKKDSWLNAMRKCIKAMMDCETIYFMPCWVTSPGAKIEHELAMSLGLDIKYL